MCVYTHTHTHTMSDVPAKPLTTQEWVDICSMHVGESKISIQSVTSASSNAAEMYQSFKQRNKDLIDRVCACLPETGRDIVKALHAGGLSLKEEKQKGVKATCVITDTAITAAQTWHRVVLCMRPSSSSSSFSSYIESNPYTVSSKALSLLVAVLVLSTTQDFIYDTFARVRAETQCSCSGSSSSSSSSSLSSRLLHLKTCYEEAYIVAWYFPVVVKSKSKPRR